MSDEAGPAKPKNCPTGGKQNGLVADLPQSGRSTVCILLPSRVPVVVCWGLALLKFYDISIPSGRLRQGCQLKPDIIFINLVMWVINKFTVTQQLWLLPAFKGVTIVTLLAKCFDFEQQRRRAGDHGFLSKSVGETDLLEKLPWHLKLEGVEQERVSSSVFSSLDSGFNKQHSSIASPAQKVCLAIVAAARGIVDKTTQREAMDHQQRLPAAPRFCQLVRGLKAQRFLEFVN